MLFANREIYEAGESLGKLMELKLPVKVSYNLVMMASRLGVQLKVIDEVRNAIIKKYGEPVKDNPNNWTVKVESENFPKFTEEFNELLAEEVDISFDGIVVPVKLPEKVAATCDKCHHNMNRALEIEPAILMALRKFVEV